MLRRLLGLVLILGSIFVSWRIQISRLRSEKPMEQIPLCVALEAQFKADLNLKSYWGQITGVQLTSQLHDPDSENVFKKCLVSLFNPVPKVKPEGYLVQVDLFDNKEQVSHDDNTRAWKANQTLDAVMSSKIIVQVSVLDAKSKNKLTESGAMIDFETLEKSQKKTR
jgi:hypothetical protein